jgi:hypothetical protein
MITMINRVDRLIEVDEAERPETCSSSLLAAVGTVAAARPAVVLAETVPTLAVDDGVIVASGAWLLVAADTGAPVVVDGGADVLVTLTPVVVSGTVVVGCAVVTAGLDFVVLVAGLAFVVVVVGCAAVVVVECDVVVVGCAVVVVGCTVVVVGFAVVVVGFAVVVVAAWWHPGSPWPAGGLHDLPGVAAATPVYTHVASPSPAATAKTMPSARGPEPKGLFNI